MCVLVFVHPDMYGLQCQLEISVASFITLINNNPKNYIFALSFFGKKTMNEIWGTKCLKIGCHIKFGKFSARYLCTSSCTLYLLTA